MPVTRDDLERRIRQLADQDLTFRKQLLEDPRAALEAKLGGKLPFAVQVLQETPEQRYLVLPLEQAPVLPAAPLPLANEVTPLLDMTSPKARRAHERLSRELIVWLVTVGADLQPHSSPVWFWWDGRSILIFSRPNKPKLANIQARPRVVVHLDGDGQGAGIVCLEGRAALAPDAPAADEIPGFVAKYEARMRTAYGDPAGFARTYPVDLQVHPEKIRLLG